MNKTKLLEKINKSWSDFNAYLGSLTPTEVTGPRDAAGWRALDHVIHLAVWEDGIWALLNKQDRAAAMGIDAVTWKKNDLDQINDAIYQGNKDKTIEEARTYAMGVHQALVDKIESMSDEDLQRPYNFYQSDSKRHAPIIGWIEGNTFAHYKKHQPWIAAIVATSQPITKAELLSKTQVSWDALNAYVATLNDQQLTQLSDAAGWTVKDHLIHLAVWEDGIWALLNKQDRPAEMGVDAETWKRWNFEEINGVIQRQHKDKSWAEIEDKRQASHKRFIEQIEATSEAELGRPVKDFQASSTSNTPVIQVIVGDAFEHYDSHLPWIKAIVESNTNTN